MTLKRAPLCPPVTPVAGGCRRELLRALREHTPAGTGANLPWMQELPDPLTSVVYGTWIEINPQRAQELDIENGDVLEVESSAGKVVAPALLYRGVRPDVVAMPMT